MRALVATFVASFVVAACGAAASAPDEAARYLDDAQFRRAELEASLVTPTNGYAKTRLAHYATRDTGDWDRLAEWNPAVEPLSASELDRPGGVSTTAFLGEPTPLTLPQYVTSADDPALITLGRDAFRRYPVQMAPYFEVGVTSREAADRYGLWVDRDGGIGGLVRTRMFDGSVMLGQTCATCHALPVDGALVAGHPNPAIDVGAARLDWSRELNPTIASWGRGRLDVTTVDGTEPVRIPDLRPIRFLSYLHHDATLVVRNRITLAIRIETLIITSHAQAVRPPRVVALALAAYLASLADALPPLETARTNARDGASLFAGNCARCHAGSGMTGGPIAIGVVGTDPALGLSLDRGTGMYRVPSLRGVGTRGPLLHDGSVPSLEALFDPARLRPDYAGRLHGTGAVRGHEFALDLGPEDRAALVSFLRNL